MKNRTDKTIRKNAPALAKRPNGREPGETYPHQAQLAKGEFSSEALKHWLQIEAELANARRGQWWNERFTS